jgi:hypothetical protein
MSTPGRISRSAPADMLRLPSPSPEEILRTLSVKPRTYNSLRRYVTGRPAEVGWSFGRLLEIPGFGTRALKDVLEALDARPGNGGPTSNGVHGFLDEEIEEVLAARPARRPAIPTPLLGEALALIASRLPASEAQVGRRLQSAGLARGEIDLGRIERASRFGDKPLAFAVLRREGLVLAVQPERLRVASLVYALAVRSVVNFGLALQRRIGFLARTEDLAFVRAVLSAKDTFQWLDQRVGWFWFRNHNSQLVRTIEKVLSVAHEVPLRDLAHVLFRRWAPDNSPSGRTLRALCQEIPSLQLEGAVLRLRTPPATGETVLADRERTILRLFDACGPRIDGHRLPEICHSLGLAAGPLGRQLRASPLVVEPRPGVFRLIGGRT